MKVINLKDANIKDCVRDAQDERVVLTRNGKPVALIVSVQGFDLEQIELGQSDEFWRMLRRRRKQKTMSRVELEDRLAKHDRSSR